MSNIIHNGNSILRIGSSRNIVSVKPKIPVTDGLVIHLDATNLASYSGTGNKWYDISGYGNHFESQSATNITFNSTYKYFTLNGGTNAYFKGPAGNAASLSTVNTYFTYILICKAPDQTQNPFTFNWNGADSRNISCHLAWGTTIYFDVNGCCGANQRINYTNANQIQSAAAWTFRSRTVTPRRQVLYNNVSQIDSGLNSTSTAWQSVSTPLALGAKADTISHFWKADLWAFYFYNRGLEDSEMSKLQEYFNGHFLGKLV